MATTEDRGVVFVLSKWLLWDLCGKAYGVPAWQLLGGRYRDKVRLYADTPGARDPQAFCINNEEKGRRNRDLPGLKWTLEFMLLPVSLIPLSILNSGMEHQVSMI